MRSTRQCGTCELRAQPPKGSGPPFNEYLFGLYPKYYTSPLCVWNALIESNGSCFGAV